MSTKKLFVILVSGIISCDSTILGLSGVPVENSGDVMHLGNSVRQQRAAGSFDQKTAYNFLYNVGGV